MNRNRKTSLDTKKKKNLKKGFFIQCRAFFSIALIIRFAEIKNKTKGKKRHGTRMRASSTE